MIKLFSKISRLHQPSNSLRCSFSTSTTNFTPKLFETTSTHQNVKAFYIAQHINVNSVANVFSTLGLAQLTLLNEKSTLIAKLHEGKSKAKYDSKSSEVEKFLTIYDFGAVVFFNCSHFEVKTKLDLLKENVIKNPLLKTKLSSRHEEFKFTIREDIPENEPLIQNNQLYLTELDTNSVSVISSVLAQSVALSHYETLIDEILEDFHKFQSLQNNPLSYFLRRLNFINERQTIVLLKLLREANSVIGNVILKIGLLDRTKLKDSVWKYERYFKIWEEIREEFELEDRWEILNTKVEYLKDNMQFFIDILNTEKGLRLELSYRSGKSSPANFRS
eukprot:snap_masked-scaffold_20-processed-gene-3.7-mRNA-1 protein AED:1.00 eAED:1.00 QI:0/0/0/0/1/1/2/0/332